MQAVLIGMLVVIAGTIPRNVIFAANLRYYPTFPWAVPLTAVYLWFLAARSGGMAGRVGRHGTDLENRR